MDRGVEDNTCSCLTTHWKTIITQTQREHQNTGIFAKSYKEALTSFLTDLMTEING